MVEFYIFFQVAYLVNKSKNWRGPPPSEKGDGKGELDMLTLKY